MIHSVHCEKVSTMKYNTLQRTIIICNYNLILLATCNVSRTKCMLNTNKVKNFRQNRRQARSLTILHSLPTCSIDNSNNNSYSHRNTL